MREVDHELLRGALLRYEISDQRYAAAKAERREAGADSWRIMREDAIEEIHRAIGCGRTEGDADA